MNRSSAITCLLLSLLAGLHGCVAPFDPSLSLSSDLVVVNGILTDQVQTQVVTLSRARSSADSAGSTPIAGARVEIIADGTPVGLTENAIQPGQYEAPAGFRGQVGRTYQLRFTTAGGVTYQSSAETMLPVPGISRAYDQPHAGLVAVQDTLVPASDIFVDYQDPVGQPNFYLWRWRDYEVQDICASCQQGRYVLRDVGPVGSGSARSAGLRG